MSAVLCCSLKFSRRVHLCFSKVLTAFNAGRLGAMTSFMGRGVTLSVSLCLSHIVHETSSVLKIKVQYVL